METNPTVIAADGLILREWTEDDIPVMHELFDDSEVAYRTPLESPFDEAAALRYLRGAQLAKQQNKRLHLAITIDGRQALGEILLGLATHSIGYAVGTAHRGQRLATRALRIVTQYAHSGLGWPEVILEIEPDNDASAAVARAAGFQRTDAKPETVTDKDRTYDLFRWEHRLPADGSGSGSS